VNEPSENPAVKLRLVQLIMANSPSDSDRVLGICGSAIESDAKVIDVSGLEEMEMLALLANQPNRTMSCPTKVRFELDNKLLNLFTPVFKICNDPVAVEAPDAIFVPVNTLKVDNTVMLLLT